MRMFFLMLVGAALPLWSASAETIRCTPAAGREFRAAVDRARAAGGGTIDFEKGDYTFDPKDAAEMSFFISNHDQSKVHRVQLPVVGVTNLTVRGHGSRFFFRGDTIAITLLDTRNVRFEDFSVDWKTPFITEARVTGFRDRRTLLDREPVYRPVGGCMLFRGDTHEVVERTGSVSLGGRHEELGLRVGDIVAIRPRDRPAPAVVVYRAVDTLFEDVVVHTADGMGWIVQRSENFTLRGSGAATDRTAGVFPSVGRITSTHADATHFSNVKGRVTVENCLFEGMMDDAINVHATCLGIEEVLAPDRLRCRYMHFQAIGFETFRPGETLRLIRGRTLENGPEIPVASVERLGDREIVVSLSRPVPAGYGAGDAVENADYHPEVVFRNNVVARNRARGALFTTPRRVLCEGNLFDHVSGSAILFAGDAQGWYESGATLDALVTNNVFRNCTTSRHSFGYTEAIVSIYPEVKDLAAQRTRYHRNVRIVGNRFETFDVPLLYAVSCSNLVFRGNDIVRNADYAGWGDGTFILKGTEGFDTDYREVRTRNPYRRDGVPFILWAQPDPINLPPLMKTDAGAEVTDSNVWEKVRRPEILKNYTDLVYGRRPVERPADLAFESAAPDAEAMDGRAVRKRVRISFSGPYGRHSFEALAFVPKAAKPVPAFLLICNRDPKENLDPERVRRTEFWPAEEIVRRGYAAVAFWNGGVAPDEYNGFTNGVHAVFTRPLDRTRRDWGALSAWAWGASRVLDWIETEKTIDARQVAVIGHSRGGKTSLWAGATDRRFALTCVNDSGCGGSRLNHLMLPDAETIGVLKVVQPHWMCEAWGDWAGRELETPFDQHQLMALVAPRLLAVGSAGDDFGAGPWGEYSSAKYASPAWRLFGWCGLFTRHFPRVNEAQQQGRVSYHLREGKHDLNLRDWTRYMDFFDQWRSWGYEGGTGN